MIRFLDLKQQVCDGENHFSFFDTVTDKILTINNAASNSNTYYADGCYPAEGEHQIFGVLYKKELEALIV